MSKSKTKRRPQQSKTAREARAMERAKQFLVPEALRGAGIPKRG